MPGIEDTGACVHHPTPPRMGWQNPPYNNNTTMKLWLKLSFAAFAAFIIVGSLYATGRIGTYRVGRDIKELGLHPSRYDEHVNYVWGARGYERVQDYCARNGQPLAAFTGRIWVDAPNTPANVRRIEVKNGLVQRPLPNAAGYESVEADLEIGRTQGLGKMLQTSKVDWRMEMDDYRIVEPHNEEFVGTIKLRPKADVGITIVLEVEENRIVSVSRRLFED